MRYFVKMSGLQGNMIKKLSICIALLAVLYGCVKSEPYNEVNDAQFAGQYCNDPIAINYNQGFPGTANNKICIYPTDVFRGTFKLRDSIYNGEFELDTVIEYLVTFHPASLTKVKMTGLCSYGDTVRLTADRYYKATVDSTVLPMNAGLIEGHSFCRAIDTIMGSVSKYIDDSNKIRINFIIASDTGINYHIGTGLKH